MTSSCNETDYPNMLQRPIFRTAFGEIALDLTTYQSSTRLGCTIRAVESARNKLLKAFNLPNPALVVVRVRSVGWLDVSGVTDEYPKDRQPWSDFLQTMADHPLARNQLEFLRPQVLRYSWRLDASWTGRECPKSAIIIMDQLGLRGLAYRPLIRTVAAAITKGGLTWETVVGAIRD